MTLVTAESSRADIRRVALSQTLRLFLLVGVLPMVVTAVDPAGVVAPRFARVHGAGPLALLLVAGLAGSFAGHRLRIPAGILIGAFLASGILHGTGVVEGALPAVLQAPALVLLGTMLGLRFSGTDLRMLVSTLAAGVGAFLAAFAAALAGAWVIAALTGLGFGQTLIAYAPGGLEVMVILAFALKVDPAFVAAHHLARFVAMTVLVPGLARLVLGPAGPSRPRRPRCRTSRTRRCPATNRLSHRMNPPPPEDQGPRSRAVDLDQGGCRPSSLGSPRCPAMQHRCRAGLTDVYPHSGATIMTAQRSSPLMSLEEGGFTAFLVLLALAAF